MKEEEIAYQNKDVTMKAMTEHFRGQSFSIYGADVPEIVDVEPTNLPVIEANELRLDNLFLLKDGSYAIVDYESTYSEENKQKYLGYIAQIVKRLYGLYGKYFRIRMIIIYTADVKRGQTNPILDMGGVRLELTEAFLVETDSGRIYSDIKDKLDKKMPLADEDLMRAVIYPLTFEGTEAKRKAISKLIELLGCFEDEGQRRFVAKYVLTFTDKVIADEDAERIRRIFMLTKVEQIIENEKQEAIKIAVSENTAKVTAKVTEEVTAKVTAKVTEEVTRKKDMEEHENMITVISNFLRSGISEEKISECTGFSLEAVREIAEGLMQKA